MNSTFSPEELSIHFEVTPLGYYIARVLHLPTTTCKISNMFHSKEEALAEALEELESLISARKQGLDSKK